MNSRPSTKTPKRDALSLVYQLETLCPFTALSLGTLFPHSEGVARLQIRNLTSVIHPPTHTPPAKPRYYLSPNSLIRTKLSSLFTLTLEPLLSLSSCYPSIFLCSHFSYLFFLLILVNCLLWLRNRILISLFSFKKFTVRN